MVMRFSGGGVGHKSTRTKAVPVPDDLENDTDVDEDWIDREERAGEDSEMDAADAGSDELDGDDYGELEDVGIDEEIDYGYADSEEDGEGDEAAANPFAEHEVACSGDEPAGDENHRGEG